MFDNFRIDFTLENHKLSDKDFYKYYGFFNEDGTLSPNKPKKDATEAFLNILTQNSSEWYVSGWVDKLDALSNLLSETIDFDEYGIICDNSLTALTSQRIKKIQGENYWVIEKNFDVEVEYLLKEESSFLKEVALMKRKLTNNSSIVLLKNGKKIFLSSGQNVIVCLAACMLSALKYNSLIILDEPELYLHPSLEVLLVRTLEELLVKFRSIAIISTHSINIAREVPRTCLKVLKKYEGEINVFEPSFQTFGANIEMINRYVFEDVDNKKFFQKWLDQKDLSKKDLARLAGNPNINEEIFAYLSLKDA